ncbi:hypothetical protein BOX15_Mlig023801g1, partial [Macrostomum lignano]
TEAKVMVVDHVILDAGAVIACSDLSRLGNKFSSTPVVMAEVKDQNARLRLELLHEPVQVRDPLESCVTQVIAAAKASGDFSVLSMADIGIVALALQVMEELGCPAKPPAATAAGDAAAEAAREYGNRMEEMQDEQEEQSVSDPATDSEDEESGWVTMDNLASVLGNGSVVHASDSAASCPVACASTDFAVQNVCARLGVPILSCEGRIIAEIRTHVLWCAGCYKRCLRPDKRFCPSCGHATLQRVSAQLDNATGQLQLFFKKNYQYRLKGTRYSLPKPRGGKHSLDPITCEWQRVPQQRPSKKTLQKANPFSVDAEAAAPGQLFAQHDLSSRAAVLGIRGGLPHWSRRNPNEGTRRTGSSRKSRRK